MMGIPCTGSQNGCAWCDRLSRSVRAGKVFHRQMEWKRASHVQFRLRCRADPVIGGDENRIGKTRRLEIENSAEAADLGIRAGSPCDARERLDLFDQGIAGSDTDAGTGVGEAVLPRHLALAGERVALPNTLTESSH